MVLKSARLLRVLVCVLFLLSSTFAPAHAATRPDVSVAPGVLASYKGTIFLLMNGEQIPFASMAAFTGLGYSVKNVKALDLSKKSFRQTKGIFSSKVGHTWGSWLLYKGTVYYSHVEGLIPVPDWETFLENGGFVEAIVPANTYDLQGFPHKISAAPLQKWDSRVWLFASEQVATRDALRLERLAKVRTAIGSYKTKNAVLPDSLEALIPEFIPSLPPPIVPPDGVCTMTDNSFRYTKIGQQYKVDFCLGGVAAEFSAGKNSFVGE